MTKRISVSPDPDGIIRVVCDGAVLEIEIVAPGASAGAQPVHDLPPNPTKKNYIAYELVAGFPRNSTKTGYPALAPGVSAPEAYPDLGKILGRSSRFDMAEFDLTDGAKGWSLDGVADQVVRMPTPQDGVGVLRLQANSFDVHGLHNLMERLQGELGRGAPKLFMDLQASGKRPLGSS